MFLKVDVVEQQSTFQAYDSAGRQHLSSRTGRSTEAEVHTEGGAAGRIFGKVYSSHVYRSSHVYTDHSPGREVREHG